MVYKVGKEDVQLEKNFLKSNFKVRRKNSIATFTLQTDFFFFFKIEKNTNKEDNVGE